MVDFIGAVSQCVFDENTNKFYIRGWILSHYDEITIETLDNKTLHGKVETGLPRSDIFNKYPEYNNNNSGWEFYGDNESLYVKDMQLQIKFKRNNDYVISKQVEVLPNVKNIIDNIAVNQTVKYENSFPAKTKNIIEDIVKYDVDFEEYIVDFGDFEKWYEEIDYPNSYPVYANEFGINKNLKKKALQHYLSYKLLELDKKDVYVDIASSNSVFPDILLNTYGLTDVLRQDLMYSPGIKGGRIGSNVNSIPIENDKINAMGLHCSWEHFENNADIDYLSEGALILQKNGKICIIPLYLAEEYLIMTSPSCWLSKYNCDIPIFDKDAIIYIDENIQQRQSKYFNVEHLKSKLLDVYSDILDFKIYYFKNCTEFKGAPVFSLVATKK